MPIHPNTSASAKNNQKALRCNGRKLDERTCVVFINGSANKHTKTSAIASTPPNLLGIERKIAYTGKKYHSGTMCAGVAIGFAGI
jgi:hypothetical protein